MIRKKTIYILVSTVLIFSFLSWAPWMDNRKIYQRIYATNAELDQTKELGCDYRVLYFPLGRFVVSCEAGYFVPFWQVK